MIDDKRLPTIIVFLVVIAAVILLAVALFVPYEDKGLSMAYETELFDTDTVIDVDILMDEADWQDMMETSSSGEYHRCDVIVNGEKYYSVGIRPKGNSSLIMVTTSGSERYSFRLKFDEYVDGQTCHGLDTLILNNNINDTTMMREAITYDMFRYLGADASLYNYASVSLNGEYFGVYVALESVLDSFCMRNYGTHYGAVYKPDNANLNEMNDMFGGDFNIADIFNGEVDFAELLQKFSDEMGAASGEPGASDEFSFGGFGSDESSLAMALNYVGDDLDSYADIWASAKVNDSWDSHRRVVTALKHVSESNELETYVDIDNVLRYMAVQTFVRNTDGLTGIVSHNYYLYEDDGRLNLIPWDYNESFGITSDLSDLINFPIDTPFTMTDLSARSFFMNILAVDEYREQYHEYLRRLSEEYVLGGGFMETYTRIRSQIDGLVATDPHSFYKYDDYSAAADALVDCVTLRAQSVLGQVDGTIPSTREGQAEHPERLLDVSSADLSAMSRGGTAMFEDMFGDMDFAALFGGASGEASDEASETGASEETLSRVG